MSTLGNAIKANRERAKLSLQGLADRAGLTKSYVWDLERGHAPNPSIRVIYGIAVALNIEPWVMALWAMTDLKKRT